MTTNMSVCADSDVEGAASLGTSEKRKKDRPKSRRKKTAAAEQRGIPKLSIINVQQQGEVLECSLETGKHSTVSFKFNRDDDQPEDIAANLVRSSYHLLCSLVEVPIFSYAHIFK